MSKKEHLDFALQFAARGWPVFPLAPKEKKPMEGSRGFLDASTNERILNRSWDNTPDANIGLATGKTAGFWILDIDGEKGSKSLTQIETEIGSLPETLESKTGNGGRHLFFKWPAAREIRNKQDLRPGIDVRGEGGYIVAPPSIHPNGQAYEWPYGDQTPIIDAPPALLDIISPPKKNVAPWEKLSQSQAPPPVVINTSTPIIERAKKYLAECEASTQGSGGHDALLWAARALVVGFELDDTTALNLLWSEFNPRCTPPWDQSKSSEKKDFERKVGEARRTPGQKPRGWLLNEYNLRTGQDALAEIAMGTVSANNLLTTVKPVVSVEEEPGEEEEEVNIHEFPVDCFPGRIGDYIRQVAESHVVDESFVGLPALSVVATAMGNAWRLQLKKGFIVPPTLWVGLVSSSGTNKSGPLNEIIEPLRKIVPINEEDENTMLNPQGRMVVSDATLEAMISRLSETPRGLMVFRDELAGWAKSFNAYKKSGGDEQAWIEFWGAKEYNLDRKTNNEQVKIPAASVSILGGIQPKVLVECFDPGKFASGLVPRLLITCPPASDMYWSEVEVGDDASKIWNDAIMWLRTRPFKAFDPNASQFLPHVLTLSDAAKIAYVNFFNSVSHQITQMENEQARSFASKARVTAGRLMLLHHGLSLASIGADDYDAPVGIDSAKAGIAWARWCLQEQLRVYGFTASEYARKQAEYLAGKIREKTSGVGVTVMRVHRLNTRRYQNVDMAQEAMEKLVQAGYARWDDSRKQAVTLTVKEG